MEKTLVFDGGGNSLEAAALMNGGMGGGMWNNPIWAIVFLAALNRNGLFGGNGNCNDLQAQINQNQNSTLLMDAIKGNSNAIATLSANLNCDNKAVTSAINAVQSAICGVGNQVGMTSAQVINAIQSGNMSLANTLQSCCCDVRQDVTKMGYENQIENLRQSQMIQNGFAQVGYGQAEQACASRQNATDNANRIIAKLDSMEDDRKNREINALTAQLATVNARAERQAELTPIYKMLSDIQAKQPNTVPVPYPQLTAVPTAHLYGYGTFGLNTGVFS